MHLSIDTASDLASLALSSDGELIAEITWRCHRNHTVELLPTIDKLLASAGGAKEDLTAAFVCSGPGMYTGLRVGVSIAQGLARALGVPAVGVGRLELDAYPHAAFTGPIVAIHRAGRGDLAVATYRAAPWREVVDPQLTSADELAQGTLETTLFVGEIDDSLRAILREHAGDQAVIADPTASIRRAFTLATLGAARLPGVKRRSLRCFAQFTCARRLSAHSPDGKRRHLPVQTAAEKRPNATMAATPMERTLILLKPDAMQRGLAGEIISRFERRGLRIAAMRMLQVDEALASRHYAEHEGKLFYRSLVEFITACPIIAAVIEGPSAVEIVRSTMGKTDPALAAPGTIRGDLGVYIRQNLIHGSDSLESAEREIDLFFRSRGRYTPTPATLTAGSSSSPD